VGLGGTGWGAAGSRVQTSIAKAPIVKVDVLERPL